MSLSQRNGLFSAQHMLASPDTLKANVLFVKIFSVVHDNSKQDKKNTETLEKVTFPILFDSS